MRPAEEWAFALSVDDEIEWCLNRIYRTRDGVILDTDDQITGQFESPVDGRYSNDIQNLLRNELEILMKQYSLEFSQVSGVGVSVVGLADRHNRHLTSIARKRWGPPNRRPVIDFKILFRDFFLHVPSEIQNPLINLHNESTAKCLAEYTLQAKASDRVSSISYVMFSEGVNSASVIDGEPPATELHTELGHIWARPFRADGGLHPDQSGCRIHKQCFEGFASSTRIFKTWNQGIETDFKNLPQDAHETIAFYIAQMCMNSVLANAPARILLGGKTVFPELIPLIKQYFKHFNDGGTGESYLNYAAMHLPDFIRMAAIDHKKASLEGALELARRVVDNPGLALKTSARPSHTSGS